MEPRVASFDYVLRGLEREREGCVSKDQMSYSELTVSFVHIHLGLQDPIQACFVELGFGSTLVCKIIELEWGFIRNKNIETQKKKM